MSCFWDGLSAAIYEIFPASIKNRGKFTNQDLLNFLKKHNQPTRNITVNGAPLTTQQMRENFTAIKNLSTDTIPTGYWCSTCDPVLILLSQLLNINIEHTYLGVKILYRNKMAKMGNIIYVSSDYGHFWKSK